MGKRKLSENDLPFFHSKDHDDGKQGGEVEMRLPGNMDGVAEKLLAKGWDQEKVCETMGMLSFITSVEVTNQLSLLHHLAFDHKSLPMAKLLRQLLDSSRSIVAVIEQVEKDADVKVLGGDVEHLDQGVKAVDRLIEELEKAAKGDTLH